MWVKVGALTRKRLHVPGAHGLRAGCAPSNVLVALRRNRLAGGRSITEEHLKKLLQPHCEAGALPFLLPLALPPSGHPPATLRSPSLPQRTVTQRGWPEAGAYARRTPPVPEGTRLPGFADRRESAFRRAHVQEPARDEVGPVRLHERQPKQHPATAATRPHARLRLRAYPVLPTPDYTPPVLPAQVRSQRAPRKSPCWPALLALAARVCSTAGSCMSAPACLHAVAPGAVLRSWLSVPLCVRLQMLS